MLKFINKLFGQVFIGLIKIYQYTLSPDKGVPSLWLKGKICAHTPHCSQYSINALKRYGFIPGFIYAMERVSTCLPADHKIYDPEFYKVVFFSNSDIGVNFLEHLHNDQRFEVVGVVTAPDKPTGRGHKMQPNIIKTTAQNLGIENIMTPEKLNPEKSDEGKEFYEQLKRLDADFLVVIAYGKIIPMQILNLQKFGPINIHLSLLPKYRGASPVQSAILNKDAKAGITIMYMDSKMDEGDAIKMLEFNVDFDTNSKDIIDIITSKGPKFAANTLWDFAKANLKRIPQDHSKATYCSKITKEDALIDIYQDSLESVFAKYKSFFVWPKIWFVADDKFKNTGARIKIENLKIDQNLYLTNKDKSLLDENLLLNPAIIEIRVKPEGKSIMNFKEFLNGYKK